ncbi:MAG TPA: alkaline phosphatase family protein [Candidatus Binatia bacterium]|nr:alkaline phosphatase family protein [Candidatus Binatia bacterium]
MILEKQRVVIGMIDGFGLDYLQSSPMPVLQSMRAAGLFRKVNAVFPTVTNTNNVSICCGAWPEEHGITGNSYFNEATGNADYMEDAAFILRPTILERAGAAGAGIALLTCKEKTIRLLSKGATLALAAENPAPEFIRRFGSPPPIYSREINYWLWTVAVDILSRRSDIRLLYVHTTDFPMHMWPPEAQESRVHLANLDALLGEARETAPDAAFLLTADHGMNYKRRCWDLKKACAERGLELRFALSAEKDRYVRHHRTFGGAAWVWLKSAGDLEQAAEMISALEGVERVFTRGEAAKLFHLMPARIGDLIVLGDRETVFGELPSASETLDSSYRSHGSLHESDVPLLVYNAAVDLPPPNRFRFNFDLTRIPFGASA